MRERREKRGTERESESYNLSRLKPFLNFFVIKLINSYIMLSPQFV